jgi:sulfur-carrier protein adenylyltransferase/sulfurtransferase
MSCAGQQPPADPSPLETILERARWAPSGDNTQPWRFRVMGSRHVAVHGYDTRQHCIYDLTGQGSQLSLGCLLETMTIAATAYRWETVINRRPDSPDERPVFDVHFNDSGGIEPDPLVRFIETRCVHRRPMSWRRLTADEKAALERAVAPRYRLMWVEGSSKLRMAKLLFRNAGLRLTMPEAYKTHRAIIEWDAVHSEEKIPDAALGASRVTLRVMKWAMQSWERVAFLNRYLAGTLLPRIEMDVVPAMACGGHCLLIAPAPPRTFDDYILAGRAMQRLWLTVTRVGLHLQPEMTPLIFASYVHAGVRFSADPVMWKRGVQIARELQGVIGAPAKTCAVFMARIGAGRGPQARSLRRPLKQLLQTDSP